MVWKLSDYVKKNFDLIMENHFRTVERSITNHGGNLNFISELPDVIDAYKEWQNLNNFEIDVFVFEKEGEEDKEESEL